MTYGSAEPNLKKIEKAREKYDAQFFSKMSMTVLVICLNEQNKILTVSKLYVMELFRELLKLLRVESFLHLLIGDENCSFFTKRRQQGLPTITYSRIVTTSKSA